MELITYDSMTIAEADKLGEIDRSEMISLLYEMKDGELTETPVQFESPGWDEAALQTLRTRFTEALEQGGLCIGAYSGSTLAGFGLLAPHWRGADQDQLQVDLLYVSRNFRRRGIGSYLMQMLAAEARSRGARYLYVSSTETGSAVNFYKSQGSYLAEEADRELFKKEPKDIHMLIAL